MHPDISHFISFMIGSCMGSFLNVCIYRIPNKKSIITPPSHCPFCKENIPFYLNLPIVGYCFTKGRCFNCSRTISLRYPFIEILTGILCCISFSYFGLTLEGLFYFMFISTLVVISFIDFDLQIIPDRISLPGIVIFFFSFFFTGDMTVKDALLGILLGGGFFYIAGLLYYMIRKKDGMGGGDIKLLAMIGAATGVKGVLFTVVAGSFLGIFSGVIAMIRNKDSQSEIPFGPWLSIGSIIYIFWGEALIMGYYKLIFFQVPRLFS